MKGESQEESTWMFSMGCPNGSCSLSFSALWWRRARPGTGWVYDPGRQHKQRLSCPPSPGRSSRYWDSYWVSPCPCQFRATTRAAGLSSKKLTLSWTHICDYKLYRLTRAVNYRSYFVNMRLVGCVFPRLRSIFKSCKKARKKTPGYKV